MLPFQVKIFDAVALYSSTNTDSEIFDFTQSDNWGLYIKAAVGTTSYYPTLLVAPTKTDTFVAPSGYPSITTIYGSAATMVNITDYAMRYAKIRLTGQAGSPSSAMTGYIFARES